MAIVNESSYHGYINLVLNRKIERENRKRKFIFSYFIANYTFP